MSHAANAPSSLDNEGSLLHFDGSHRRLSWKKLAVILLLILPITAAVVYMWSMYDPSKTLRDVNLAVVNQDKGAERDGEFSKYGDDVVHGLLDRDYLSFSEVSADEAAKGLDTGKYLFTITIPEDFSANVNTLMNDKPVNPEVTLHYNDFNGTNGTILTEALVPKIQREVSSSISESYAKKLIDGVNTLGDGITQAADGSKKLDDGATQLNDGLGQGADGAAQLDEGANKLKGGTKELKGGTTQLVDGTGKLVDGTGQLADGANTLVGGTQQLGDGAGQIDEGVGKITGMLLPLLSTAQGVVPKVAPIIPVLRQLGFVGEAEQLQSLVDQLDSNNPTNQVDQLNKLKEGTATLHYMLSDPSSEYLGGILKLQDGINQADSGARQLNDGALKLDDGATQLDAGTTELTGGTSQLVDGTQRLKDGSDQLKGGTGELSKKLAEGAAKAPKATNVDASAKQVALPIIYNEDNENPVQLVVDEADPTVKHLSGGASLLFVLVFGFLLMAIAAICIPHVFGTNRRSAFLGPTMKSFVGLVIVGVAILALLAVGATLVGWDPASWGGIALTFLGMAGASAGFNQMLRAIFGRLTGGAGILAAFALGMFSFGGVWPLPTVPKIFQWLHPFTPMSYARNAFAQATQGIMDSTFVVAIVMLGVFTFVPLGITLLVRAARVRRLKKEHAEAIAAREPEPAMN